MLGRVSCYISLWIEVNGPVRVNLPLLPYTFFAHSQRAKHWASPHFTARTGTPWFLQCLLHGLLALKVSSYNQERECTITVPLHIIKTPRLKNSSFLSDTYQVTRTTLAPHNLLVNTATIYLACNLGRKGW